MKCRSVLSTTNSVRQLASVGWSPCSAFLRFLGVEGTRRADYGSTGLSWPKKPSGSGEESARASHSPVSQPWAACSFRQSVLHTPRSLPLPGSNTLRSSCQFFYESFSPPNHTSGNASALPRRRYAMGARLSEIPPNPHARIAATSSRLSPTRLIPTSASADGQA